MKDGATKSFGQSCNCQVGNDKQQVVPMVEKRKENLDGKRPKQLSADNGCFSEENVTSAENDKTEPFIATNRQKHGERVLPARGRIPNDATVKGAWLARCAPCAVAGPARSAKRRLSPSSG
jgi:hypothetical protein